MADAIVSGVVGDAVGRAISFLAGRLQDRPDVEGKLRRLRHLVVKIESALDAAGERRITSRALLAWLSELLDVAHRGRYLLDAGSSTRPAARSSSSPATGTTAAAARLRVAARRLLFGNDAVELDAIAAAVADLEGVSGDLGEFIMLLQGCPPALHRPPATNIYADCQMFGRHVERRRVMDFLLQDDIDDGGGEPAVADLGVLPIIGRAGLGKTTLVQHVCAEPAVRRRFSLIVLLDFHCMSLTAAGETAQLVRSLFTVAGTATRTGLAAAGDQLSLLEQKLRGERFLAVFDNVDVRKKQVIHAIMPTLRRGRRGNRVIVTGGDKHAVADLGTEDPVVLRPLPPAEYWFFFKAHAFTGAGDAEADPRRAAAGQAIAKRLRRSFLGAKVVGALLRSRPEPTAWRRVLAARHAGPPWLRNGGYVAAATASLLPAHVTVHGVAVAGSPVRGVVGLQDAALTNPPHDGGGGRRELPLLLCKSVFPSYCLYYIAYCNVDGHSKS
ncbi:hypothetical protein ACP4OV_009877 [Aristida adscensionis]